MLKNSLFENVMHVNGIKIPNASKKLMYVKSLQPDEFKNWKEMKRWKVFNHHLKNNDFYNNFLNGKSFENWEDIPIINKSDFQTNLSNILSNGYNKKNVYIANTSGSSGHPFFFAKNKSAHAFTWAFIKWRYENLGLSLNSLEARFYGIPLDFVSYIKEKIKDSVMKRVRFPVFDLSDEAMNKFTEKFENNNFSYIYGYANSVIMFAKFIKNNNIDLLNICPTLNSVLVTAEVCTNEDKELIKDALKVPVYNEYGCSEFGYIGYDDLNGGWQIADEMLYVEKNKEDGCLLITDLHNKAYPFIRFNIGDVGDLRTNNDQTTHLKSLQGRLNDTIILPSGKKSPGLTFYYVSRSILEKSQNLKEFIIKQVELDKFIFEVVSDKDFNEIEINMIKKELELYLEPNLRFKINRVDKINRPKSGKIKHFHSYILDD